MIFKFHHVSLSVKNIEVSIKFYNNFDFKEELRFTSVDGHTIISHLKNGSVFIELFQINDSYDLPKVESVVTDLKVRGLRHFALQVDNIELTAHYLLAQKIISAIPVIQMGRTGIRYFFLRDPDETFIEIIEDKRPFNCS